MWTWMTSMLGVVDRLDDRQHEEDHEPPVVLVRPRDLDERDRHPRDQGQPERQPDLGPAEPGKGNDQVRGKRGTDDLARRNLVDVELPPDRVRF
jgi:hypothetical protein